MCVCVCVFHVLQLLTKWDKAKTRRGIVAHIIYRVSGLLLLSILFTHTQTTHILTLTIAHMDIRNTPTLTRK